MDEISAAHPRLLVGEDDFAQTKKQRENDVFFNKMCEEIISRADAVLMADYPVYDDDDSIKLLAASDIASNLLFLSFAYKITGEDKYLERTTAEMDNAASFKDWNHKAHFLDTATLSRGFSLAVDWLYNDLTSYQRDYYKSVLYEKCVYPASLEYTEHYCDQDWARIESNWGFVCNSGALIAALCIGNEAEYVDESSFVIQRALGALKTPLEMMDEDGSWYEGPLYGEYSMSFYMPAIYSLSRLMGDDFGFLTYEGVVAYKDFVMYINGANEPFNFGDGGEELLQCPSLGLFSKISGNPIYGAYRVEQLFSQNYATYSVWDALWYNPVFKKYTFTSMGDMLFKSNNTAVFHGEAFGSNSSFAGIHGGYNNVKHGHLDAGTFVYDVGGVRFASDMGQDNYYLHNYWITSEKNPKNRWCYYRMRAEGHNTLVINPDEYADQVPDSLSEIENCKSTAKYGYAVLNLSDAYQKNADSVYRGFKYSREDNSCFILDEIELKGKSDIYWFMHTMAGCEVLPDGKSAILSRWGKRVWIGVLTDGATLEVLDALPFVTSPNPNLWEENKAHTGGEYSPKEQNANSLYKKISIKLQGVEGFQQIGVYMIPLKSGENVPSSLPLIEALQNWK